MLRTHSELGYKQEQRFHLELGLLKMAHAQRLLPIEQLLSQAAGMASANAPARTPGRPSNITATGLSETGETRRSAAEQVSGRTVSPFAADSAQIGRASCRERV